MLRLGWSNWARLVIWRAIGLAIYFTYGSKPSSILGTSGPGRSAQGSLQ
jgi:hypothetical protein